jgi:hypothetical protein
LKICHREASKLLSSLINSSFVSIGPIESNS